MRGLIPVVLAVAGLALTEAARLARPAEAASAGLGAGVGPAARFGAAPPVINAVHRSAARLAVFAGVAAAGVIMLAVALVLALRRRAPAPLQKPRYRSLPR
jgi:hypothetical protein